ncbi:MAG: hypothetical protein EA353_04055 [Puniceicoccaceae bacterium]|nr:MAG: hypothetical protein EA353_04055 [Puniceicoccaceae bacterium]
METYIDHPLCWAASALCCLGVLAILFTPEKKAEAIYRSTLFLPTYSVGILAWLLYGMEIGSVALVAPCVLQLAALAVLFRRAIIYRLSV